MPMNLAPGTPPEDPAAPLTPPELPSATDALPPVNPSLFLSEEDSERFGLGACRPGEDYTATVTLRHPEAPEEGDPLAEGGKTLEIVSMSNVQPAVGGAPDAEPGGFDVMDPEEKMLGYARPKRPGAPPAVDMKKFKGGRNV